MKVYDKYIYKTTEQIKSVLLVLVVFVIGFLTGCVVFSSHSRNLENKLEKYQQQYGNIIEEQEHSKK